MTDLRRTVAELEAHAVPPDVPHRERLRGYAVTGLPFRSGHLLAMRRFPASSIGPAYTSLWHRDPAGRLVVYQDVEPRFGCPRAFGPAIDDARVVPISIAWTGPHRFRMDVDGEGLRLRWHVVLSQNLVTRGYNAIARAVPPSWRRRLFPDVASRIAQPLLGAGRVRLSGTVPSGQAFLADLHSLWLIEESTAVIDGVDLGVPGPLGGPQLHLRDFWLPTRGLFGFADAVFEPYEAGRHLQVASREELAPPGHRRGP